MVWCWYRYGVVVLMIFLQLISMVMSSSVAVGAPSISHSNNVPKTIMTTRSEAANAIDPEREPMTISVNIDLLHAPTIMNEETIIIFVRDMTSFLYERFQLTVPEITIHNVTLMDQVLYTSEHSSLYLNRVLIDVLGSPYVSNFDVRVRNMISAQGSALVRELRNAGEEYFHNLNSLEAAGPEEEEMEGSDGDEDESQFDWIIFLCTVGGGFAVVGIGVSFAGLLQRKR